MATTTAPRGLGKTGRALWRAVCDEYELTEHERAMLREACRTADLVDRLQVLLDDEGLMSRTSQGPRLHPAVAELRQQRIAFARQLGALHIPVGEEHGRTQHRGLRGVYHLSDAS